MLVLGRQAGDTIVLEMDGRQITILILKHRDGRFRIGIEAPKDVNIRRGELPVPQDEIDADTVEQIRQELEAEHVSQ